MKQLSRSIMRTSTLMGGNLDYGGTTWLFSTLWVPALFWGWTMIQSHHINTLADVTDHSIFSPVIRRIPGQSVPLVALQNWLICIIMAWVTWLQWCSPYGFSWIDDMVLMLVCSLDVKWEYLCWFWLIASLEFHMYMAYAQAQHQSMSSSNNGTPDGHNRHQQQSQQPTFFKCISKEWCCSVC